ncbi:conserved hypothetical protein [Sporisorium reilianum SRZ2]|uniref:SAGA-associated factor 11 n=1 Tax=Sporisorium reilianum (strain SRZ2) TaxID=999809 RepID=E6ZYA2_SPORE|nr:conserved hypothetical protein [Sporisorium reilianum SRZ2]
MSNDPKALLAAKFLDSFLREIVLDTAIHTHAKIKRARSICHLCGVPCQAHTPAAEQSASSNATSALALDTASTPSRSATPVPGSTATAAAHKPDYYSNNPLFECLVCSRQVSSNRYATHLAKCMGMGSKGGRKGAARNAKATTSSLAGSNRQSGAGTPRYASDADDDSFAKRKNGTAAATKNGVKRGSSPLAASPLANARMHKRIKTSSPTPPPADSLGMGMNRSYSSQPFAPSGLSTSTVLSGSPLNPNNAPAPLNAKAGFKSDPAKKSASSPKKRKRLIDDDDEDDADSYHDASDRDSNEEEGEISDDDDDDDVALAAASSARPPGGGTKIKIPLRATPSASSTAKPKTFVVADDSDSDTVLSTTRKSNQYDDADDQDDDDDEDDDDDDDDDDDQDDDDDDDDVQVTRVTHRSAGPKSNKPAAPPGGSSGLQRERGSDGEFIDVESASDQSNADSF